MREREAGGRKRNMRDGFAIGNDEHAKRPAMCEQPGRERWWGDHGSIAKAWRVGTERRDKQRKTWLKARGAKHRGRGEES